MLQNIQTQAKRGRPPKPKTKIDNATIERMFMLCATDEEVDTYFSILDDPSKTGYHGRATSYASKIVFREFKSLLSLDTGLDYSDVRVNDKSLS